MDAGARPRIPEPLERVRDAAIVGQWVSEKGMLALTLRSPDGTVEIDFLVGKSARFSELERRAMRVELDQKVYRVAHIDDLIRMKLEAGRPQDQLDVEALQAIKRRMNAGEE